MPNKETQSGKVIQILSLSRAAMNTSRKSPMQNVPSPRDLVRREFSRRPCSTNEGDIFEQVFRDLDDETFWQLMEFIEEAGYSIYHASCDIEESHENFRALRPSPDET
ncbi:hypothetical protein K3725_15470 [Leisingera sp. S132]|uniref:hypothetical protein n=1 Tax=Leisingera sp. S132 TaxID=2867016 RepID=UPI0021A3EB10|nr:hypothetical protein [Leisingera sp. S132]UWQ78693.1 hypothetical protein K3725_15470 [Leisingera sp. S132]